MLALLLACGGRTGDASPTMPAPAVPAPAEPVPAAPAPTPPAAPDAPRASCKATTAASRSPLSHVTPTVESFALAWRRAGADVDAVIVALDARGALELTPVPVPVADPVAIGEDPGGLVIVSVATRGTGTLLRVDLRADGSLRPRAPKKLPDVPWGWPAAIGSDGERAILEHTLATAEQGLGGTVLHTIDLATLRVLARAPAAKRAQVHCHAGACTTVELAPTTAQNQPSQVTVVRGAARLELELHSTCPTLYPLVSGDALLLVGPGAPWRAVAVARDPPALRELALDPTLAPLPGCPPLLHVFPSASRPGLIVAGAGARTPLRWDLARGSFGAGEPLPASAHRQSLRAAHPDGVLELAWTGGHGMMHSPTDAQGSRRYFTHWSFDGGQLSLLRHRAGSWAALDPTPLVLAGVEGTFHDGYQPILLRHGLHAAALLVPDGGGDEAWLQPYLAPCP